MKGSDVQEIMQAVLPEDAMLEVLRASGMHALGCYPHAMSHEIEVHQDFPFPVSRVFADLSDHESLGRIMGAPMMRIVDGTGADGVNGIGSVRRIGSAAGAFEERVVSFEQDELIEYTVTKGSPIKNHLGRMVFSETPTGSHLHYVITFDSKLPFAGGLIASILGGAIRKGLRKYAAGRAAVRIAG